MTTQSAKTGSQDPQAIDSQATSGRDEAQQSRHRFDRRAFLGAAGAVAGAAAVGLPVHAYAANPEPKRGGTLRFGTQADSTGLDQHRHYFWLNSVPLAATAMGMMDIDSRMNVVPGMSIGQEASKDLKVFTFKMRDGATYHDGSEVSAESVKWNFERILDPKIGNPVIRAPIEDVERIEVLDKRTLRLHLKTPNGVLVPSLAYYPLQLISPASGATADTKPVGCGPFKFVSWKRNDTTVVERYEGWYEKDAQGRALPYLDQIIGKPIKEDTVRLTALRTGQLDLIENMSFPDAVNFRKENGDKFQIWPVAQGATAYIGFNHKKGILSNQNPHGKLLRQAIAHAINDEAIHQGVFSGLGETAVSFFSKDSPWYMPGLKRPYPYDPDKARFLIKKAGAVGEPLIILSRDAYLYIQQTADIVQALLTEVGFKVRHEIHSFAVLNQKWKAGDFDLDSNTNGYRADPDFWFGRYIHSESGSTKLRTGYKNPKADALIEQAAATLDKAKRLEIYREVEMIVNEDLPLLYTHFVPLLQAGASKVRGYASSPFGPFSTQAGGIRSTWLA